MAAVYSNNDGSILKGLISMISWMEVLCIVLAYQAIKQWYRYYWSRVALPVVGDTGFGVWLRESFGWAADSTRILQDGYEMYGGSGFQFYSQGRWQVCLCDEALIKEYIHLPDEYMSLEAFNEGVFETKYTSPGFADSLYHIPVPMLSRALAWSRGRANDKDDPYFQAVVAELEVAVVHEVHGQSENWHDVNCLDIGLHLMLRLIGKVLVGEPLCRDQIAMEMIVKYGSQVPVSGGRIAWLPNALKPLLGPYFAASRLQARISELIVRQIRQTRSDKTQPASISDWLWRWVQQEAVGLYDETHVSQLVVAAFFGSVHSAGMTLAGCLYEMSRRPQYLEPLRKEAQQAIQEHGNTLGKEALECMTKLDSFIKECQRFTPLTPTALHRIAKQDYTFKNGLTIPKGTYVVTPNTPILRDGRYYDHPHEFDGLRFHELGQATGEPNSYKIAGLSPKSRQFGDGRHTCPGKQLAADLLRLIMAYLLLNFEVDGVGKGSAVSIPGMGQQFVSIRKRNRRS